MRALTLNVTEPVLQAIVELHAIEIRGESVMESSRRKPEHTAAELLEEVVLARFQHVTGIPFADWMKRRRSCVGGRGSVSVASAGPHPKERTTR